MFFGATVNDGGSPITGYSARVRVVERGGVGLGFGHHSVDRGRVVVERQHVHVHRDREQCGRTEWSLAGVERGHSDRPDVGSRRTGAADRGSRQRQVDGLVHRTVQRRRRHHALRRRVCFVGRRRAGRELRRRLADHGRRSLERLDVHVHGHRDELARERARRHPPRVRRFRAPCRPRRDGRQRASGTVSCRCRSPPRSTAAVRSPATRPRACRRTVALRDRQRARARPSSSTV